MPPVARGSVHGRGKRSARGGSLSTNPSSLHLLVKKTQGSNTGNVDRREEIEADVAQLLAQTGLYKNENTSNQIPSLEESTLETVVKGAEDAKELEELEKKLIPPKQRYPPPSENLIDQISKDVEWAAEVTIITSKHNALRPQKTLDHLRVSPIESWPTIESLWNSLWAKRNNGANETDLLDKVFGAFEDDLDDLKKGLQKTLGKINYQKAPFQQLKWTENLTDIKIEEVDNEDTEDKREHKKRRVDDHEMNPQWLIDYLENTSSAINKTTKEPFWNIVDPDDEIYTDSEEEDNQTNLRYAPFIRPLRKIVRNVRRQEELHTICGRSLRVLHETQDPSEVLKDTLRVVEEVFYDDLDKEKRQKRQKWRQWVHAARYAQWKLAFTPSIPLQLFQRNCYVTPSDEIIKSLESFQVLSYSNQLPVTTVCRAFLRHFASRMPHRLENSALDDQTEHSVYSETHSPFDWTILSRCELTEPNRQDILDCDDRELLKIKMAPPGLRFYVGDANSIWGTPSAPGYQRTHMGMELFFWLKRLEGLLLPLHSMPHYKPRKQRPRVVPAKLVAVVGSAAGDVSGNSAMSATLALQPEGVGMDPSTGAWGQSIKVTTERDSSDSENELKSHSKEEESGAVADKTPWQSSFHWSGFAHDNDVVRIGKFGRLRNVWDKPRRRRLGLEIVPYVKTGRPRGHPVAPDYSSSEDSCLGLIEDQKKYRMKPRVTRKLIKKQKERVLELRRAVRASNERKEIRKKDREGEVLSSIYGHSLGPLEPAFEMPKLRSDWPGSPLDSYEEKLQQQTFNTAKSSPKGLDNHLEMALSSAQQLGTREECWTYLTEKKERVRGVEPRMDHDPNSKIPLGFIGFGTDLAGSEYQLVGVDNNEFWRRKGDNKTMHKGLSGYEDLLKGCRDYYAIIDEDTHETTIVPGGTLSLFWTKSAKQCYKDLHWYAMYRLWITGRFRRRFGQKALRYQMMKRQGYYAWQDDLDKLLKISNRISEGCAFRKAKYTRPRTHAFQSRRELDKKANPELIPTIGAHADEDTFMSQINEIANDDDNITMSSGIQMTSEILQENSGSHHGDILVSCGGSQQKKPHTNELELDWEDEDGPYIPRPGLSLQAEFEEEASRCRSESLRLFNEFNYNTLFCKPTKASSWTFGWNGKKSLIASCLARRYGHILSRYYQGFLPYYSQEYQEARNIMAEKFKAEAEFAALSKRIQKKKAEVGRSSGSNVLDQQLAGAVSVLEKTDKNRALGLDSSQNKSAEQLEQEIKEERVGRYFGMIASMRMCLPLFNLSAITPEGIYQLDDGMERVSTCESIPLAIDSQLINVAGEDNDPQPVLTYFEKGFPQGIQGNARWTKTFIQLLHSLRSQQLSKSIPLEELKKAASKLKILNWLIKFYKVHTREWRNFDAIGRKLNKESDSTDADDKWKMLIPLPIVQWITERFLVMDETGVYSMNSNGEIKLMTTILWLILHLSGEWKFDYQALTNLDWDNKYTDKFQNWATLMGMKRVWKGRKQEGDSSTNVSQEYQLGGSFTQEWELVAPLTVSQYFGRGRGLVGVVDAQFAKSPAAIFFKEDAAKQQQRNKRRGGRRTRN